MSGLIVTFAGIGAEKERDRKMNYELREVKGEHWRFYGVEICFYRK